MSSKENSGPAVPLKVLRRDLFRATLAADCGNLGYLGFAPDGSAYHVVAPVDLKLARGVKALNLPDDGTPFGGYRGWHYFCCEPYDPAAGEEGRQHRIDENLRLLTHWLKSLGIEIEVK